MDTILGWTILICASKPTSFLNNLLQKLHLNRTDKSQVSSDNDDLLIVILSASDGGNFRFKLLCVF